VTIDIRNSGTTPAKHLEFHGSVFLDKFPLDDGTIVRSPIEPKGDRHSKLPLYPGEPNSVSLRAIFTLPPQVIADLTAADPKYAVYMFGEANYVDIFGIKRKTQFCRFMHHSDFAKMIDCARRGVPIDPVARWSAAHILNSFS
jgi:hypothetical protein